MDRFEAMSVLLAVADAGSLSAGARRLGMPLATVSRKVSDLEAHLHTRLLSRGSRRLELTDAGQSYVAACRKILDDVLEAERAASGEYLAPRGELVVTAPVVFGRWHLLPIIEEFLKAYPDIDVQLTLSDGIINLLDEHVDLALRIGDLPDSNLIATRIGAIGRIVCASPDYLARRGVPLNPADLAAHDCISFVGLMSSSVWAFTSKGGKQEVAVHSRLVVNTAEAAVDAAVAGLGVTRVLSYQAAKAVADGKLTIILQPFEPATVPASLVYKQQGLVPLKLRAFLDFAIPRLKAAVARSNQLATV